MFTNIGGKIKVFVIVATILNIFACIVFGGIMITYSILGEKMLGFLSGIGLDKAVVDLTGGARGIFGITAGIVIIVAGSFACWIIAFIPYGLGQMIQNSDRLVKNTEAIKSGIVKIQQSQQENGVAAPYGVYTYPVYTDQFGRPIYPTAPYAFYSGEENAEENEEAVNTENAAGEVQTFAKPEASQSQPEEAVQTSNEKTISSDNNDQKAE